MVEPVLRRAGQADGPLAGETGFLDHINPTLIFARDEKAIGDEQGIAVGTASLAIEFFLEGCGNLELFGSDEAGWGRWDEVTGDAGDFIGPEEGRGDTCDVPRSWIHTLEGSLVAAEPKARDPETGLGLFRRRARTVQMNALHGGCSGSRSVPRKQMQIGWTVGVDLSDEVHSETRSVDVMGGIFVNGKAGGRSASLLEVSENGVFFVE